jgi:hypothetical protein
MLFLLAAYCCTVGRKIKVRGCGSSLGASAVGVT